MALRSRGRGEHSFDDPSLDAFVENARHALAIDERRSLFPTVPFGDIAALNRGRGFEPDDRKAPYQERWTPGTHGSVVRLALRLIETAGLKLGAAGGKLDELIDRPADAVMDAAIPLYTGDTGRSVGAGYDRDGRATFVSAVPLPAIVVAAMPKIEMTDG